MSQYANREAIVKIQANAKDSLHCRDHILTRTFRSTSLVSTKKNGTASTAQSFHFVVTIFDNLLPVSIMVYRGHHFPWNDEYNTVLTDIKVAARPN